MPEKFIVALWFNAEATKGVYMGMDKNVSETHSYSRLARQGLSGKFEVESPTNG